jgi:Tol biopolymer transport system component
MSDLRFSPWGDRIAYFEHPRKWDDRGSVNIVDLAGKNTVLSEGYWSERGLAWSPKGDEVLFSASLSGGSFTVYGVTLTGRRLHRLPGARRAHDPGCGPRRTVARDPLGLPLCRDGPYSR